MLDVLPVRDNQFYNANRQRHVRRTRSVGHSRRDVLAGGLSSKLIHGERTLYLRSWILRLRFLELREWNLL